MTDVDKAQKLANAYALKNDCDVLLCNGPMRRTLDIAIHECLRKRSHPNVLLILTTEGGNAHVAYRVARHLQQAYGHVRVFVSGWCKSAGTLLAVCGHELIVGDRGELGPVDVQRGRTDDLWQSTSGLTETAAVTTLEEIAWSLFKKLVTETKDLSAGQITFKTAAEAAAPLVSGMLTPIFAQIDPLKLGENTRALEIASEYADRLDKHSQNLLPDSRRVLISGYPDHGFVIDREEARTLFRNVDEPSTELHELIEALGDVAIYPDEKNPVLAFINENEEEQDQAEEETIDGEQGGQNVKGNGATRPEHSDVDPAPDGAVAAKAGRGSGD